MCSKSFVPEIAEGDQGSNRKSRKFLSLEFIQNLCVRNFFSYSLRIKVGHIKPLKRKESVIFAALVNYTTFPLTFFRMNNLYWM